MKEARNPPCSASRSTSSRKRSRPSDAAAGDDLISALPDSIILHVLSFLDIQDVVKTSALSRRWYSLWTQTSAISVDFKCAYEVPLKYVEQFLLMCMSPAIRKFHLLRLNYFKDMKERVDRWVRFAIGRRVEDLRIQVEEPDFEGDDFYILPRALLQCDSLTMLRLESCTFPSFINVNLEMISWSLLKVLSVHLTKMVDEVINGVLEGSPLLESLTLEECWGMSCIRILSKKMKELVIHKYFCPYTCYTHEELQNPRHKTFCLEIFVPNLSTLRLLGQWEGKKVVTVRQVRSLVDVELDFSLEPYFETDSDIIYGTMKGILSKLRFVDKVMIGDEILMDLHNYKGNGDFSLQLKCRHLTITTSGDRYSLERIAEVLESAPNVETLIINFTPERKYMMSPPNRDPLCDKSEYWNSLTGHIRNIEITGFSAFYGVQPMYGLPLIKFLLQEAEVLEKMVINVKGLWWRRGQSLKEADAPEVLKVAADILGYPRGSKAAKVILNHPFK